MNHDAVDYFRVDFTAEDSIVGGKHYPLGSFAAEMLAFEWNAAADIRRPLTQFREEFQIFLASRSPSSAAAALGAMELPVTFELASLQLRVDELAALTPGYTLALGGDIASVPVSIRVGGRLLARGRLVDVGGMPGVQIEALEPAGDAGDTRPAEDAGAGEDAGLQEGNADGTGRD